MMAKIDNYVSDSNVKKVLRILGKIENGNIIDINGQQYEIQIDKANRYVVKNRENQICCVRDNLAGIMAEILEGYAAGTIKTIKVKDLYNLGKDQNGYDLYFSLKNVTGSEIRTQRIYQKLALIEIKDWLSNILLDAQDLKKGFEMDFLLKSKETGEIRPVYFQIDENKEKTIIRMVKDKISVELTSHLDERRIQKMVEHKDEDFFGKDGIFTYISGENWTELTEQVYDQLLKLREREIKPIDEKEFEIELE